MLIPVFIVFTLISCGGLLVGIWHKSDMWLLALNLLWWCGGCISAYFAWLTWKDRGYSEHWAMIGFMLCTVPYALLTGLMLGGELFFIRTWQHRLSALNQIAAAALLIFLIVQLIIGVLSIL